MSFTLVTLCDDAMRSVGELTEAAWREYAKRHGYRFVAHSTAIDRERHPAWSKILAVEAQLREEGGIVMWVDADTFPMNFEFPAHTLLPSRREVAFASDFNGLNSGVFLIRSSDWSLGFLKTVYWLKDVARDPDGFGEKWEQNTIKAVLDQFQAASGKVAILPERAMNSSVASFHPGDFLLHLGGMTNAQRLHHLRHARRWVIR